MNEDTHASVARAYVAALGYKKREYYVQIFEKFEREGPGLKISWNWAAFLFTGVWALYRKMYGWFLAWLVFTMLMSIFSTIKSPALALTGLAITLVAASLFGAYANSLYHVKIKSKLVMLSESSAILQDKSSLSKSGVNSWVPVVFGGLPLMGLIAAFVVPVLFSNSQNKSETEHAANVTESSAHSRNASSAELKKSDLNGAVGALQGSVKSVAGKTHTDELPVPEFMSSDRRLQYLSWKVRNDQRLSSTDASPQFRAALLQTVWYESQRAGLDPNLVLSIISNLSGFRKFYVDDSGARGLMVVSTMWFKKIGEGDIASLFQMQINLRYGCVVLRHYLDERSGVMNLAVLDYVASSFALEINNPRVVAAAKSVILDLSKWE